MAVHDGMAFHHELGADLIDRRRPGLPHDHPELVEDDLEHLVDTFLAERAEPPHVGTTDPHGIGAERQGFEDICASTASSASSRVTMPFTSTFIDVASLSRLR